MTCIHKGCGEKPLEGKFYCAKHIHGRGKTRNKSRQRRFKGQQNQN